MYAAKKTEERWRRSDAVSRSNETGKWTLHKSYVVFLLLFFSGLNFRQEKTLGFNFGFNRRVIFLGQRTFNDTNKGKVN